MQTDRDDTRVNSKDLATWLERTFGDNYLIWNLSSKNRNTIDYGLFKNQACTYRSGPHPDCANAAAAARAHTHHRRLRSRSQVQEFQPFSRVDMTDETPAIGQVFRILYTLKFFLEWDPATTGQWGLDRRQELSLHAAMSQSPRAASAATHSLFMRRHNDRDSVVDACRRHVSPPLCSHHPLQHGRPAYWVHPGVLPCIRGDPPIRGVGPGRIQPGQARRQQPAR